jgi:prepilin-type N-terminal cleavage/methylation domain-containing protein
MTKSMSNSSRAGPSGGAFARAFTLVEILVVVLILGIAAAVIVPSMGSRDDLKAAAAARMVMADLIYAQNRAITTQQRHYVIFNTTAPQSFRLSLSPTDGSSIQHPVTKEPYSMRVGPGGASGLSEITLGNVSFEGRTTLAFDELGVPYFYDPLANATTTTSTSGGSSIQIRCGTHTLTILIEPYTGEIKVN